MKSFESQPNDNEAEVIEKLAQLIESDEHTMSLTVSKMALRDLAKGDIEGALSRLLVDLDKIRAMNPALYEYVSSLVEE